MTDDDYKKFTAQAKAAIKGEAFFEALVSNYSIPHHIVGLKDVGIDYICEWVYGDKPTGILYAVQVKTLSRRNVTLKCHGSHTGFNELEKYKIRNTHLEIDDRTLTYWRGFGMPVFLFTIIYSKDQSEEGTMDCYYKRFTPALTTNKKQEDEFFYKVNMGSSFMAFADPKTKTHGFARDLFIDLMRCAYYKGSIAYISPRTMGLQQFPSDDAVFYDVLQEYRETICRTYKKTKHFLDKLCKEGSVEQIASPDPVGSSEPEN